MTSPTPAGRSSAYCALLNNAYIRKMPKAYSYIRMSTKEQLKGDSATRQLKLTKEYVAKHNLQLQDIIDDIGKSAFRGLNVEFGKLSVFLKGVRDGKIEKGSYLIVESLDRLSRENIFDALGLLTNIVGAGIIVVTLSDGQKFTQQDMQNDFGRLIVALTVMMRAHEESKIKSQRMSSAWSKKREDIKSGKVTKQRIPAWLKFSSDGKKILPQEDRTLLLREIFELSRDGYGAYSLARTLNSRNEKPWGRSKMWRESYIKKILSSRTVLGEFQPMKLLYDGSKKSKAPVGDPVQGYYPAIIDAELFAASQLAISKRKINGSGRKGASYSNPFTGLLQCGACGSGVRYLNKGAGPKGGKYLQCANSHLNGDCTQSAYRYPDVEEAIFAIIEQVDFEAIIKDVNSTSKISSLKAKKHQAETEIAEISARISNLTKVIEQSEPDQLSPALGQRIFELENQQAEKREGAEGLQREIDKIEMSKPKERQIAIADIMKALGTTGDPKAQESIRRKLSAELKMVLSHISIRPIIEEPIELELDPPAWYKKLNVSLPEFRKLLDRFGFEILLSYDNGKVDVYNALTKRRYPLSGPEINLYQKAARLPRE